MLNALLDLVLPGSCAGCGAKGMSWCSGCQAALEGRPARRMPTPVPPGLPDCWSAAPYEGPVRRAIVAYKERGVVTLAAVLAEAIALTAMVALAQMGSVQMGAARRDVARMDGARRRAVRTGVGARGGVGGFVVVPVPSARSSLRARGHDPVGRLAELVAGRLREAGWRAEVWAALGQGRRVADQAGLSSAERVANLAGSLRVVHPAKGPPAAFALLLDDIVTTGATLAEAAGALRATGVRVPLAVTAGATRRRS